jgi:hypothetical protein
MDDDRLTEKRFALQSLNVRLGWCALLLCAASAVAACVAGREDMLPIPLLIGVIVFRITQRNRLENKASPPTALGRIAALFAARPPKLK